MKSASTDSLSWRGELTKFFEIDLRGLAVFRIALAVILLGDLGSRLVDLQAHYTDAGVVTRQAILDVYGRQAHWSIHRLSGAWQFEALLFCVAAASAAMLLLGYRTRLATIASWALLISLHARNPFVLTGGDTLLRVMLFWSIFVPLGSRLSVDALRTPHPEASPTRCSVATAILLLQVCIMYWFTSLFKQNAMWKEDGTALFYALNIDQVIRPWCKSLLDYPTVLRQLSFATVYLESFGPFLFFVPFNTAWSRPLAVILFGTFHFVTFLMMDLGLFPWVCLACLLLFLPTGIWDSLSDRWEAGRSRLGNRVPWLRIAPQQRQRKHVKKSPQQRSQKASANVYFRKALQLSLIFIFAMVFIWNFQNLGTARSPKWLPLNGGPILHALFLDQQWNMFSKPERNDGWFVLTAVLNDGKKVDLLTGVAPSETKPNSVLATFPNYRWRKLTTRLWFRRYRHLRPHFAEYMTRQWNHRYPDDHQQVREVQLHYFLEQTTATGPGTPQKFLLYDSAAKSKASK